MHGAHGEVLTLVGKRQSGKSSLTEALKALLVEGS